MEFALSSSSSENRYKAFRVRHNIAFPDPDMPQPRYHNSIYVETDAWNRSGVTHEVVGDITSTKGMTYNAKNTDDTMHSDVHDVTLLGLVLVKDYPKNFEKLLTALPTPPKQKGFNTRTMRTEPIKSDGSFYAPQESRAPLWKCTEWTEKAIAALQQSGILVREVTTAVSEASDMPPP